MSGKEWNIGGWAFLAVAIVAAIFDHEHSLFFLCLGNAALAVGSIINAIDRLAQSAPEHEQEGV